MRRIVVLLSTLLLSSVVHADHTVSLSYRFGDFDYDLAAEGQSYSKSEDASHVYAGYRYNFDEHFSLGIAYLDGSTDTFLGAFDDILGDDVEIEYSQFRIEGEGRLPISQRNYLFGQLSVARYQYDLLVDDQKATDDDGVGFGGGAGWGYQFDNGFGVRAGFYYDRFDSDIEMKHVGWDISYRF